MRSLRPNPSCRYQTAETALARRVEPTGQMEREGFLHGLRAWQESCPCCFSSIHPEGVPTGPPMALDARDIAYVRSEFEPLEGACSREGLALGRVRGMVHGHQLPKPPYVLPDGTEMVPADYFDLLHDAGSSEGLEDCFVERFMSAAAEGGEPASAEEAAQSWAEYLSGEYFVCLKRATPEDIVRKGWLVPRIEKLVHEPRRADAAWRRELRSMVDELDSLERQFAAYDRERFGSPSSRDRLITAVRREYL